MDDLTRGVDGGTLPSTKPKARRPTVAGSADKKLKKELERKGWTLVRQGKHQTWRCGCGDHQQVTVSTSVGRGRGLMNAAVFLSSTDRFGDCAIDKKKVLG
jgi:hypothetical protein